MSLPSPYCSCADTRERDREPGWLATPLGEGGFNRGVPNRFQLSQFAPSCGVTRLLES